MLVTMALLVAGGFLAPNAAFDVGTQQFASPSPPAESISMEYSSGQYTFAIVVFSWTGAAIQDAAVFASVQLGNNSTPVLLHGVTDSAGLLTLDWRGPECRCLASFQTDASGFEITDSRVLPMPPPTSLTPLTSPFSEVYSGSFVARQELEIAFAFANGTVPAGTAFEYCVAPPSGATPTCSAPSGLTHGPETLLLNHGVPFNDSDELEVSLINSSGALLASQFYPGSALDPNVTFETSAGASLAGSLWLMSFFVAFAAALVGYLSYGRDRLDGALDAVMALPISRGRLMAARYGSAMTAVLAAVVAGVVALSLEFVARNAVSLPPSLWLAVLTAFATESLIFVGLSFFGAHLTRSSSLLVVVLALVCTSLTLLWIPLVATIATGAYIATLPEWVLANPAQVSLAIVGQNLLGSYGAVFGLIPTAPSYAVLAASATVWSIVPTTFAFLLFRYRD